MDASANMTTPGCSIGTYPGNHNITYQADKTWTLPLVKKIIYFKLCQLHDNAIGDISCIPDDKMDRILRTVVEEQAEIGWDNLIKGYISLK
eukprot:2457765-Ditylum_brightwellii.AAC.1